MCGFDLGALRGRTATPAEYTPNHLAQRILQARQQMIGERKNVTVLFANVVCSTALVEQADPEETAALLAPAITSMMDAVHRFGGTVNDVAGDGIMALFGAPVAHDDHAVRACYSALAIPDLLERAADGLLRARVGLHSGEVLVQSIDNDLSMDYTAIGPTVHLA